MEAVAGCDLRGFHPSYLPELLQLALERGTLPKKRTQRFGVHAESGRFDLHNRAIGGASKSSNQWQAYEALPANQSDFDGFPVVHYAHDGDHSVIAEIGGPERIARLMQQVMHIQPDKFQFRE